jgi:hypothetical protein
MTTQLVGTAATGPVRTHRPRGLARRIIGGFYLFTGGIHVGIVAADPQFYDPFADEALFSWVRTAWSDIFMAAPATWGLVVALGEVVLGVALLLGGRWAKLGWAGVVAFHLGLMLTSWGIWVWCIPALVILGTLARADWPRLSTPADAAPRVRGGTG